MTTPDETAEKILKGVMYRPAIKFSEFRMKMLEEHPDYLRDDAIHDLYMAHVVYGGRQPTLGRPSPEAERMMLNQGLYAPYQPEAELSPEAIDEHVLEAVEQVVEWSDANRATPDEVRKAASKVQFSNQSRRKKKSLGDVTLREAFIDGPKRAAKRARRRRRRSR